MKKSLIIANWKMNPVTLKEAKALFLTTANAARTVRNAKVVICPPFVYLSALPVTRYALWLGAQDVFWESPSSANWRSGGSYTGEISAKMLKDCGVQYVIIGHSERRLHLKETDEMINKKIKQALENNLKVIFCVGESERDEAGQYLYFVKDEIIKGLEKISAKLFRNLIIAYEPVWAISSVNRFRKTKFHPDTPENAYQMATYIKRVLVSSYGKIARRIPVLYGGSVDSKNVKDFLEKGNVDGLLVGRASWDAKSFRKLLKNIN